jgi:hypothetical protein
MNTNLSFAATPVADSPRLQVVLSFKAAAEQSTSIIIQALQ